MSIGGPSSPLIPNAANDGYKKSGPSIEMLPPELLDCVVDYLPATDLKNLARASKMFSSFAIPALYSSSSVQFLVTGGMMDRRPELAWRYTGWNQERRFADVVAALPTDEKARSIKRLHVEGAYTPCLEYEDWRKAHELLRRLPGLTELDITWLATHQRFFPRMASHLEPRAAKFEDPEGQEESDRVSRLIEEFGDTTLQQLTYVFFNYAVAETPRRLLEKMSSLKILRVRGYGDNQWDHYLELMTAIRETVSTQLEELGFWDPPPGPEGGKEVITALADRAAYPQLKAFRLGQPTFGYFDDRHEDEERILLLWNIYEAAKNHGGWKFLYPGWEIDLSALSALHSHEVTELLAWLKTSIPDLDGFVSQDECSFIEHPEERIPLIEEAMEHFEVEKDVTPFRLHLKTVYPPTVANDLLDVFVSAAPIMDKVILELDDLNELLGRNDERRTMRQARRVVSQWDEFLLEFLPKLETCWSIAYVAHADNLGCALSLKKYASIFAELCEKRKLRKLDIDVSGLLQPDTAGRLAMRENPAGQLREVIVELDSILPKLPKLKELTLRHLFILRPCEMDWLKALPGRMPSLETLKIYGLQWHGRYDKDVRAIRRTLPGFRYSGAMDDGISSGSSEHGWEDTDDDSSTDEDEELEEQEAQAALFMLMAAHGHFDVGGGPHHPPVLDPVLPPAPIFTLPNLPPAAESDSDEPPPLESAINSSDEEDAEPSPSGHAESGMPPSVMLSDDEQEEDQDDAESTASTGSKFGGDSRFKEEVVLELRKTRFIGWLSRALREASGGKLQTVVIDDVGFDASGMQPWTRREELWESRCTQQTRYGWTGDPEQTLL